MPMPRASTLALLASSVALLAIGGLVLRVHLHGTTRPPVVTALAKPVPAPPPQPHWTPKTLRQLLAAVEASRDEGLRPGDYRHDELADALKANRPAPEVALLATAAARSLAHDYADGRIVHRERFGWHIGHSPALASLDADLAKAVDGDTFPAYLTGLLPKDRRYDALRTALHDTPADEPERIDHIRASMERWRWMPRTLGSDYIWVNLPTYRLALYQGDTTVAMHDVVVGARKTPTPMLAAHIGSVIVNPWWTLPPTVLAEGKRYSGARGYVTVNIGGRAHIRQRPGPSNALGRVKIDMPNPYAIYLHDTPAKALFARSDRALSHGCIRVKDIATLADKLVDAGDVDGALTSYATKTLQMQKSVPVYIVYFTAAPDDEGKVVTYPDPYQQDGTLVSALDRMRIAARPTAGRAS
jgi:murein L,D-transpeptidase YcbB/YkuD